MTDKDFNIPDSLITALKNGRVIPFVGAGILRAVIRKVLVDGQENYLNFPSWKEYVEILIEQLIRQEKFDAASYYIRV